MLARTGWVGPLIGLTIFLLLIYLVVPVISGVLATILNALFIIGAVVCAVLLVASFIPGRV
jgi:hypothetical protein